MDFLGKIIVVTFLLIIIIFNNLFFKKLKSYKIKKNKIKVYYFIGSIFSLILIIISIAFLFMVIENYFISELHEFKDSKIFRIISLNLIIIVYALLHIYCSKLILRRLNRKNKDKDIELIGSENE